MDHQTYLKKLKSLDDNLATEDLAVLKFLCQEIITPARLDTVKCPLDLFDELESTGAMGVDRLQVLAELLFEAQRIDLMRSIGITQDQLKIMKEENGHMLNAYRRMLHELSEYMISSDVKQLKRVMKSTPIPRARLEEASDAYALFSLLEKQRLITSTDVTQLLKFTEEMDEKGLGEIVSKYIADHRVKNETTRDISIQCDTTTSSSLSLTYKIPEYVIRPGRVKGLCIVINNDNFVPVSQRGSKDELVGPRAGSSKDAEALHQVFSKLMFDVRTHTNLTSVQIYQTLKNYALMDHSKYDAFVCCVLTHGEAGKVFGTDCLPVSLHSLLSRFTPKRCKSLEDKPKLFFVQACQGGRQSEDSLDSIPLIDGPATESGDSASADDLQTDFAGKLSVVTNIPRQPDYLLGLATVPGYVSYRSKSTGSWYIQALCDSLSKLHNNADLLSILTEVNDRVITKQRKSGGVMATQMPLPQHTLRRRVFLRTETR